MTAAWLLWTGVGLFTARRIYACFILRTASGKLALLTPTGWIAAWQVAGLALVPIFRVSPSHHLWWIPLGYVLTISIARALVLAGFQNPGI